jgi:hypothetical protein
VEPFAETVLSCVPRWSHCADAPWVLRLEEIMKFKPSSFTQVFAVFAILSCTVALPTQSSAQTATSTTKATASEVSNWTQQQWNSAKAEWVKEKDKWASCNKQAKHEKLSGRKSWSFLYACMTK